MTLTSCWTGNGFAGRTLGIHPPNIPQILNVTIHPSFCFAGKGDTLQFTKITLLSAPPASHHLPGFSDGSSWVWTWLAWGCLDNGWSTLLGTSVCTFPEKTGVHISQLSREDLTWRQAAHSGWRPGCNQAGDTCAHAQSCFYMLDAFFFFFCYYGHPWMSDSSFFSPWTQTCTSNSPGTFHAFSHGPGCITGPILFWAFQLLGPSSYWFPQLCSLQPAIVGSDLISFYSCMYILLVPSSRDS